MHPRNLGSCFLCSFWVSPAIFPEGTLPTGHSDDRFLASAPLTATLVAALPLPASCLPTQDLCSHCPFAWNVLNLSKAICRSGLGINVSFLGKKPFPSRRLHLYTGLIFPLLAEEVVVIGATTQSRLRCLEDLLCTRALLHSFYTPCYLIYAPL